MTVSAPRQLPLVRSWRTSERASIALCSTALLCAALLQKIALPGTRGELPLNLVILPALTAWGFVVGTLEINVYALISYALFGVVGFISLAMAPSADASILSLGYLLTIQMPLLFTIEPSEFSYETLLKFLSTISCICAAIGVFQFAAQFVVGRDLAFFLDTSLPEGFLVQGYNVMNPLYWGSPFMKSNGFFFLEPSFFCQFLALGMVAELLLTARIPRIIFITSGLLVSYSGTGLTTLALFIPFYIIRRKSFKLILFGALICIILVVFADVLSLNAITGRFGEFSDSRSSGSARFVSIFWLLNDALLGNDLTFLFGRGPGTVEELFQRVPYEAFDPTWVLLLYEVGIVGALAYTVLFITSFVRGAYGLRFVVGYNFFFLGGYLINPSVLMQMAALVVWPAQVPTTIAAEEQVSTS